MSDRQHWLRRRLFVRLLLPMLAIFTATAGVGALTAQRLTDSVFDRWLLDAAQSLAHQVRLVDGRATIDLPPAAEAILAYDEVDRTSFSVVQLDRHLVGQTGLPTQGSRQTRYHAGRAYDANLGGRPVRVASVDVGDGHGSSATVLVAETTLKRERTQRSIVATMLPMGGALIATMVVVIGLAVRRTIQPLELIAARWNERSHASLQPIGMEDVPRELTPFATALNDLLLRMRAMLARERQFAATAAHQLRTPLTGIQLGLNRAAHAPDLETARAVMAELELSTQRAARLVQQLLTFGRLDPETVADLVRVPTDLIELVRDVGDAQADLALGKSIDLELQAPAAPVIVRVQVDLVEEALSNLLHNALQYTPSGGRVSIEVQADPPAVCVSDSGPGVPDHERETIFARFARGEQAAGEGSGLGLAIARDIATLHGASLILVESALGGASFRMTFPSE
jgi:two-component system sensor histidine kinase TctE